MPNMGQRMGCPRVVLTLENTDGAGMSQSKASRDAVTSPSRRGRRRLRADWWGPCPSSPEAPWRATPFMCSGAGKPGVARGAGKTHSARTGPINSRVPCQLSTEPHVFRDDQLRATRAHGRCPALPHTRTWGTEQRF